MRSMVDVRRAILITVRRVTVTLSLALTLGGIAASVAAAESTPPVDEALPAISGTAAQGDTLEATHGTWTGSEPISYAYQWERCDKVGCQPISGATSAHHTVVWQDAGMKLAVKVSGENEAGHASATSAETALVSGGTAAVGWGRNYPAEQLGSGIHSNFELTPVPVRGIEDVKQMGVAGDSSYALLANGTIKSWGASLQDAGPLGYGSFAKTSTPQTVVEEEPTSHEVHELRGVVQIATGGEHVIALLEDGEVETWGASEYGERGNGESDWCYETRECIVEGKRKIAFSETRIPGTESTFVPRDVAVKVPGLHEVVLVAAAGATDYAVLRNGTVMAWGSNTAGMLGDDFPGSGKSKGPEKCGGNEAWPCVKLPHYVCAVGAHIERKETREPKEEECSPAHGDALEGVSDVSAGAETGTKDGTAYAISHGRLVAWGNNKYGQVGAEGEEAEILTPVYVHVEALERGGKIPSGEGEHAVSVAGGNIFGLALLADGQVIGWGSNAVGELSGESEEPCHIGKPRTTCQDTPKVLSFAHEVTEIAAGVSITLARSDGGVEALGNAELGELGIGTPEEKTCGGAKRLCSPEPVAVAELGPSFSRPIGQIVAGNGPAVSEAHSFAVLESGTPPLAPLSVTALAGELELTSTYGTSADKVKWKGVTPEAEEEIAALESKDAQDIQEAEEDEAEAAERRGAGEEKAAEEDELRAELRRDDAEYGEKQIKKLEAGKWEATAIERSCTEASPCHFLVSKYEGKPLESTVRYELKIEGAGVEVKKVSAKPLP